MQPVHTAPTAPDGLAPPSSEMRGSGRAWPRLVAELAWLPVVIAVVGALAARPIADDYTIEGGLTTKGGAVPAFQWWMHSWTGLYSLYASLNAGAALGRAVGTNVYYPATSLLLLVVLAFAVTVALRSWASATGVCMHMILAVAVVMSSVLGSFASFGHQHDPVLFGALYWPTAWASHLLPVLLLPIVFALIFTFESARSRGARTAGLVSATLMGVVLTGFGFAEAAIALIATGALIWAIWRLWGASRVRRTSAYLIGFGFGLVSGFFVGESMPGTSNRQHLFDVQGVGSSKLGGPLHATHVLASVMFHNLAYVLWSPALPIGAIAGYWLRRFAAVGNGPTAERRSIRIVGVALGATLLGAWVAISLGDAVSYRAWWHLWPLFVLTTALAAVAGWGMAATREVPTHRAAVNRFASIALVGVLLWGALAAGYATSAVWDRRGVFDKNVAAARAVRAGRSKPPAVWRSQPAGGIVDMQQDHKYWVNRAVSQWLGVPADDFVVTPSKARSATLPLEWLVGR